MSALIRGAGGGGGKGGGGSSRAPQEAPDSLRSKQYARVLDLVSEGEIEGLVNGNKSIYLDDTPLQNADGTYNFTNVTVSTRNGTQSQSYIPGFPATESEIPVGVELKQATPVTRTITNANVGVARVTVSTPALSYQDSSTGDISGTSVAIAIDLQSNGGGYTTVVSDTLSGKTTSRYQRSYRVTLTGAAPWDIRVRRITADSVQSNLNNKTFIDSYTEVIETKLKYPNSAIIGLQIDAAQFRTIPRRAYELKLLKVKVPVNYNPITRVYSGVWDGTFKVAWTDNPAWCFYDLLTNARYGLGAFIAEAQVDKWALYSIAQYCDALVSNGYGGTEPRFTCNLYLQTREEAYKVIVNMASVFRAMVYWASGAITAVQDKPADAVYQFTNANVVDGMFTYSGSSRKARHTVALVSWNDPDDAYRQKVEYVEDQDGIARYGVVQTEIVAVGCISRGQAHRMGRWLLYSERMETETVTFRTGLEGYQVYPGAVIRVLDEHRAGVRFGGRVLAATTTQITLDSSVTLQGGKTYTLYCLTSGGAVESRAVSTAPSTTAVLTVSSAYSVAPQAQSVWVLAASDLAPQTFRVISVAEVEGIQQEIVALKHDTNKYAAVEQNLTLEPLSTSYVANPKYVAAPINLIASEELYLVTSAVVGVRMNLSWEAPASAAEYLVEYRPVNGNWTAAGRTRSAAIEIGQLTSGVTYEVRVTAFNSIGVASLPATLTRYVVGKTAAPADVTGYSMSALNGFAQLTWSRHPDLDVLVGGKILIRHSKLTSGANWQNAVDVTEFDGASTSGNVPLMSGTYLAKALDSSGNYSVNSVSVISNVADIVGFNAVETATQHPAFTGTKTNTVAVDNVLKLIGMTAIDAMTTPIDDWGNIDALGGIAASGSYYFANRIDLGGVFISRITAAIKTLSFEADVNIDSLTAPIDEWGSIDGNAINTTSARLYVRTSDDNVIWSDWRPFFVGDYKARSFEFRADLATTNPQHNIQIEELAVTVDMEDRVESGNNIAVPGAGSNILYANAFRVAPALGITAENMATGDYYTITNKSETGFTVVFKNAAGAGVSRTMDWVAKGYGYKV